MDSLSTTSRKHNGEWNRHENEPEKGDTSGVDVELTKKYDPPHRKRERNHQ